MRSVEASGRYGRVSRNIDSSDRTSPRSSLVEFPGNKAGAASARPARGRIDEWLSRKAMKFQTALSITSRHYRDRFRRN